MKKHKSNMIEEATASEERAHAQEPKAESTEQMADGKEPAPNGAVFHAEIIPLAKLIPSPTNPRKRFGAEAMEEMTASMREHGFTLSTLLVRAWPETFRIDLGSVESDADGRFFVVRTRGGIDETVEMCPNLAKAEALLEWLQGCYEIVAGERRYRAALAAGILEAPCIVRELSDIEVIEQQLVENLQRQDLTAMETALGFCQLLSMRDGEGQAVHTVKTLHQKTGKSVRMIERHLRLRVLTEDEGLREFLTAFEADVVGFRHALTVARMPDAALRARLAKEILHPKYEEAPLSVRKLEQLVQNQYMVDLREAPFDLKDEQLVGRVTDGAGAVLYGGACKECPMRLGNAPDLFEGALPNALANMCMNPSCFEQKRELGWARWQEAETDAKKKRRATSEKEARALFPHGNQLAWNCGLVELSDRPDSAVLKAGEEAPGTWRSLVKGTDLEVIVTRDRNGKAHELVNLELAMQAGELNGHNIFKAQKKETPQSNDGRREQIEKDQEAREVERYLDRAEEGAVATALYEKAAKSKKMPEGLWREIAGQLVGTWSFANAAVQVAALHGMEEESLEPTMAEMPEEQQLALLIEIFLLSADSGQQKQFAALFGLDDKTIRKEARAKAKAEMEQRKKLVAQIQAAAEMAKLKPKTLDEMAEGFGAEDFQSLRDVEALVQMLNSIVKMADGQEQKAKEDPRVSVAKGLGKKKGVKK